MNYFDTAEYYGYGNAETLMGRALRRAGWARKDFVLSSKFFSAGPGVNDQMLSRKHIIEGINASLKRLQLDYLDVAFAHTFDYETPIEEVCRAFDYVVNSGKAMYWGTSNWTAYQVAAAFECCERHDLIKPVVEQPEYNMLIRNKVESDLVLLFDRGYGAAVWSPLAGGLLSGKYNSGTDPVDSRYHGEKLEGTTITEYIRARYVKGGKELFLQRVRALGQLAEAVGCTQAQLGVAWCLVNRDVSVTILGASRVSQLQESLRALAVARKWTPEVEKRVEEILGNQPDSPLNWRDWEPMAKRRGTRLDPTLGLPTQA